MPSKKHPARHTKPKPTTAQRARSLKLRVVPVENSAGFEDAATAAKRSNYADIAPKFARLLDSLTSEQRKQYPITAGLTDYFPDALAEASHVSWLGNEKHNPGEPLHHARGKSMDHADCCGRHLQQRGGFDIIVINGVEYKVRHSAALVWRALALLQEELEHDCGYELPRNARA